MKGALPVPYIVALIIALIVIAILAYWFFVLSGRSGTEADIKLCEAKAVTYCAAWAATRYGTNDEGNPVVGEFKDEKCHNLVPNIATDTWCKEKLGQQ